MTVRVYPIPNTPYRWTARVREWCEPCEGQEQMVLRRVGSPFGELIPCPACTRRGAVELRSRLPREDTGSTT